jgi:hypothetical protein
MFPSAFTPWCVIYYSCHWLFFFSLSLCLTYWHITSHPSASFLHLLYTNIQLLILCSQFLMFNMPTQHVPIPSLHCLVYNIPTHTTPSCLLFLHISFARSWSSSLHVLLQYPTQVACFFTQSLVYSIPIHITCSSLPLTTSDKRFMLIQGLYYLYFVMA